MRIIEDALEADDRLASSADPLRQPKRVDEQAQARASEPPFGDGPYTNDCAECGFRFRTDDRYAVLCPPCDADDLAQVTQAWAPRYARHYSRFRRNE